MKKKVLSILVLLSMVLVTLPAQMAAQEPESPQLFKVLDKPLQLPTAQPQRMKQAVPEAQPAAPKPAAPQQGTWHQLAHPPFDYTRFDCAFVPGPADQAWANKIYCPGGRTGSSTEATDIWMFDPVTLTWTDTGVDVVEDVSNYTANLVMDDGTGNGPAIYIIGGYNADGSPAGNIGTVQRFYPQTGVAEALPAADDWTVTVAGNLVGAMGTAVVDNVIYVFGGWENATAPYFYAGTWAFDPSQPSGSRWTDLGLVLTPARSYIQVAVQNGQIYAMGGIYQYVTTPSTDLVPTDVVEVLDTANLAAGWQTVSPMPVASGEGRGFGFDADTLVEAPIPWDGHIYVAGGGDWPDTSAEAMEYLTGPDSWNQAFPDLNQARRDHAGVFVPLCTPDPDDGLPGLWVFGGRMASESPPYGDPEYYPLPCPVSCNVLVVDDDWDFDQVVPNDGGRPYYTSTLDYLGYNYTVWDTVSQGDPTTADLAPYDVVLWFTGYAWQNGVFTPDNEQQVAAYLDGGGNFILSSEDYYYEAGTVTPFMANYLGIDNFPDEDVVELDPVGNAGNPVGNGLGPYAMVRPDDWAAYWPTGSYEGPYDDYAEAALGADEPFRYNASAQNNSTNYDSGTFKTIYLAWPFEWIDTVEERAEILGAALDWMCGVAGAPEVRLLPPYQEGFAEPGTAASYDLTLVNLLGISDTFDIEYTGNQWPVTGPATIGPLNNGVSQDFQVEVDVPAEAGCMAEDWLTVTAWDSTATYSDTSQIRTVAGPDWQVENNSGAPQGYWMADTCTDDYGTAGTCFYAGGLTLTNAVSKAVYKYDIASGTWAPLPNLLTGVFGATAGYIDGKLYVAGGFTTTDGDWGGTGILQVYDFGTNSWSYGTPMDLPDPFTGLGGTAGGADGGKLYVLGGCYANTCSGKLALEYDPVADVWNQLELIPDFVSFHGGAVGQGRAYVAGDYTGTNGFFELDIALNYWTTKAPLPVGAGKKDPVMAVVPQGVFLWGGDLGGWTGDQDTTWYWGRVTNNWVEFTAKLNTPTTAAGGGLADNRLWNFAGAIVGPPHESLAFCIPPTGPITGLQGYLRDANTGDPLAGYVYLYNANDPNVEYDAYADPSGYYTMTGLISGTFDIYAAMVGYGRVDDTVTIVTSQTTNLDFDLPAPVMGWDPAAINETVTAGESKEVTLLLGNTGTSDLVYRIDEIAPGTGFTPASTESTTSVPAGVDPQVYADLAASPDGTAEVLVVMAEKADLSAAYSISDWSARGQYVYNTLKATAERSQAAVRKYLDERGIPYHSHISLNSLSLTANKATVDALAARPEVAAIRAGYTYNIPEPIVETTVNAPGALPWNITNVQADQVWGMGVTGQGIVVANIDTGVQYDHPALVNQYRGNLGGGVFDHNYNWWDPRGACVISGYPANTPCDNNGHGTHTMGSIAGSDLPTQPLSATHAIGMAPGAQWIACKGCEEVEGWPCSGFALLECADFMLAPWDLNGQNPDPDKRPHVINNSWGGGAIDGWYSDAVAAWRAAGIFPAFSGGNSGPMCETVHSPSDYYNSFATGAVDKNDLIASFSSRGPALNGTFKPQVTAPGVAVESSVPTNGYDSYSGTSMASPHTAGELALLWSAQPQLIGQVQLSEWLIMQTADPLTTTQECGGLPGTEIPNYTYGWGRINAYQAVSEALAYDWDVDWLDVSPDMGTVATGGEVSVTVNLDAAGLTAGECYTATLKIETNDPYQGLDVFVPVELCVEEVAPVHYIYLPVIVKNH